MVSFQIPNANCLTERIWIILDLAFTGKVLYDEL